MRVLGVRLSRRSSGGLCVSLLCPVDVQKGSGTNIQTYMRTRCHVGRFIRGTVGSGGRGGERYQLAPGGRACRRRFATHSCLQSRFSLLVPIDSPFTPCSAVHSDTLLAR